MQHGFFAFGAVGATNVGSVRMDWHDRPTNVVRDDDRMGEIKESLHSPGKRLGSGDSVGCFRFGSTVVLIFDAPADFQWAITPGQKLKVGQPLCKQ